MRRRVSMLRGLVWFTDIPKQINSGRRRENMLRQLRSQPQIQNTKIPNIREKSM